MKIAYLCSDVDIKLLGHQGCSVHIREFTNALVDAGHEVFILCSWLGEDRTLLPKARVYQLEPTGSNRLLWETLREDPAITERFLERDLRSILWNSWLQNEGAAIFERERPDFVYERYALFGTGGLELARRFGLPRILELNAPLCDQQEGYDYFPLIRTARTVEPTILRSADAVVALTDWLADWAVKLGVEPARIHTLPDAVAEDLFGVPANRDAVRERLGCTGRQVVGFVGSFHRWHDITGLLDAFLKVHATDHERRLLLVGDGHTRKKLEARARSLGLSDAVFFVGNVPHREVPSYLAAMDVAVVPYQPIEDFFFSPMKLFESMAMARPTVAASLGQIAQVIEHGRTGWLYPAGDNAALAESIETLLQNPALATRIGHAAKEHVLAHHTWDKVTGEVVSIVDSILQERAQLPDQREFRGL
jgi:glycosyltransferase involved in cell wall biosynthesis